MITSIHESARPEAVADRSVYIGSSDARDILAGGGAWVKMWQEKTGRVEREDLSDNFKVQLGVHTEGFHLDWTLRKLGETSGWMELAGGRQYFGQRALEDGPTLGAHIDAAIVSDEETEHFVPVEAKHTGRSMEELLEWYMPQLQHIMWACRAKKILFSAIIGNAEPERVWVGASESWITVYLDMCRAFWSYIEADECPALHSPGVEPAQAVRDAIPINGMTRRNASTDNEFMSRAYDYVKHEESAKSFERAKKDLKAMIGADESELYSDVLVLRRTKAGAVRFNVIKKAG